MAARTIDPETLEKLAGDPTLKPKDIAAGCGFGKSYFFMMLGQNQRLTDIYETARAGAGVPVFKAGLRTSKREKRASLDEAELSILDAIRGGCRTMSAIRTAVISTGHAPAPFAAKLYNLENERHEIWTMQVGCQTHYFLRCEAAAQQTANSKQHSECGYEVSTTTR